MRKMRKMKENERNAKKRKKKEENYEEKTNIEQRKIWWKKGEKNDWKKRKKRGRTWSAVLLPCCVKLGNSIQCSSSNGNHFL